MKKITCIQIADEGFSANDMNPKNIAFSSLYENLKMISSGSKKMEVPIAQSLNPAETHYIIDNPIYPKVPIVVAYGTKDGETYELPGYFFINDSGFYTMGGYLYTADFKKIDFYFIQQADTPALPAFTGYLKYYIFDNDIMNNKVSTENAGTVIGSGVTV